jgi:ATP-dependent phosphoenolpyruvate carboxykinase
MKSPNQLIDELDERHVGISPSDVGAFVLATEEYTGSTDADRMMVASDVTAGTYGGAYETDGGAGYKG